MRLILCLDGTWSHLENAGTVTRLTSIWKVFNSSIFCACARPRKPADSGSPCGDLKESASLHGLRLCLAVCAAPSLIPAGPRRTAGHERPLRAARNRPCCGRREKEGLTRRRRSPTLCQSLAQTLVKSCPHFAQVLPKLCTSLAHALPKSCPDFAPSLPDLHRKSVIDHGVPCRANGRDTLI